MLCCTAKSEATNVPGSTSWQKVSEVNRMDKLRWLWFAIAVLIVLTTPSAVFSAIQLAHANRSVVPALMLAVVFRLAFIWFFFHMWWKYRSPKQEQNQS